MNPIQGGGSPPLHMNAYHSNGAGRHRSFLLLLALQLAGILTYSYFTTVEEPFMDNRIALHNVIVTLEAPYQFRYRVLVPFTIEGLARVVPSAPVKSQDPLKALPFSRDVFAGLYGASNFLAFAVMLNSLGVLLSKSFPYELALFGMALSAVLIGFTFRDHYFHPWSFWEGAFFTLGLLLIQEERFWLFTAVNLLGVLNRETSVFLCIAFLFSAWPTPMRSISLKAWLSHSAMRFSIFNLAAWVLGYFILHALVGYRPPTFFIQTAWEGNTTRWPYALLLNALFLGPLWFPAVRGIGDSPLIFRKAALTIPLYLGLLLVIGFWWEIRYWISMIPFLVVGLCASFSKQSGKAPSRFEGDDV